MKKHMWNKNLIIVIIKINAQIIIAIRLDVIYNGTENHTI